MKNSFRSTDPESDYLTRLDTLDRNIKLVRQRLHDQHPPMSISAYHNHFPPLSNSIHKHATLEGQGGIYDISWAGAGSSKNPEATYMLASVSSDGSIMVWNTQKKAVISKIAVRSQENWLMCCAFERREGSLLAAGGMEGKCYLYKYKVSRKNKKLAVSDDPKVTISAHESYVSSCEFVNTVELATASGDMTCCIWNIEIPTQPIKQLAGHTDDIMSISVSKTDHSLLLTASCDKTVKLWDIRDNRPCKRTFEGHKGHVNSVKFLNNSPHSFISASSDGVARLFDMRALRCVGQYKSSANPAPLSSVCLSLSSRILFCGDEAGFITMWDLFDDRVPIKRLESHSDKVTSMEISTMGSVLASASVDGKVNLWKNLPKAD